MQGQFWFARNERDLERAVDNFKNYLIEHWDFSKPVAWKHQQYKNARSLSQNALLHIWARELSVYFIDKGSNPETTTEENMKLYLKQQFLGFEDIIVGKTVIPAQLKKTSKLDKGEMYHFMDKVYHWAIEVGCTLSLPEESEFVKLRDETHA